MLPLLVVAFAVQQATWTVGPRPTVRIGQVEGEDHYMFAQVASAVRLGNGTIVVANGASNELRAYDPAGKHVKTLGRQGSGPGEFQTLRAIWVLPGDSIMAMDARTGRLTVFGPDLEQVRFENVPPIPGAMARLADGSYIATQGLAPPEKRSDFRGVIDFEGLVLRRAPGNTVYDTIVRGVKAGQSLVVPAGQAWRQSPFPFGRSAQIAVGRTRIYYGSTHGTELGIYDQDGRRVGTARIRGSGRSLTNADIEKWIETEVEKRRTQQAKVDARNDLKQIPNNARTPEFAALKVDDTGNLWVRAYGPPWDPSPTWDVYTVDGRPLARVRMPAKFEPMHIGRDFVLGVSKDEFDVEHIELLPLRK